VAKPELGTKRLCANCAAKFYDLGKDPIVCPKCDTVFIVPVIPVRAPRGEAARAAAAAKVPVAVEPETADAEFVSLEDAEAEQQGKKKPGAKGADGEEEVAAEDAADDTFIEEQDEGDDDVTDIIGDAGDKEEET
jgi:uncharacterized protein (TIGR02300 family)